MIIHLYVICANSGISRLVFSTSSSQLPFGDTKSDEVAYRERLDYDKTTSPLPLWPSPAEVAF